MAEFILGNPLRHAARRHPGLRRALWRVDFWLIWLLVKLFALMPADFASRLGQRVGSWIGPRLRRKTAIYRENMRTAFPELGEAALDERVRRAWGRAGRILAEYPHLETILAEDDRLEIVDREASANRVNPSRPCVVVAGHISNWEVVCSAMAKLGMANASLYSPPTNPYLDRMLSEKRRALNCELLPRDNSARLLMRALKQGRTVGMVMDRRVDEGHPISFFGREKLSTLAPARLALKFDCDLVPVQVERLRDARYRVTFHRPVKPGNPRDGETEQAVDMIRQVHLMFEDWIRQNPEDWFCSKRLWDKNTQLPSANPTANDASIESYAA